MTQDARPIDPEELLANAGWLRALARSLVRDAHLAEDVVQQSLAAAIERPPREGVPLRAWLARVARNLSLNAMRSRSRRARHEGASAPPPAPSTPEETAARAEMLREAFEAVLALDPPLRDVVLARFFDGLDWPATSRRLGVPVETARTRLKRAMSLLRERLDRRTGGRAAWVAVLGAADWPISPVGAESAVGAQAAATAGGAIVGTAAKAAAVVAVALVVGAGWWVAAEPDVGETSSSLEAPSVGSGAGGTTGRAVRPMMPGVEDETRSRSNDLPPPVDLDACDRDLDLCGRVLDEAGAPIAGATLETSHDPWMRLGDWRGDLPAVTGPSTRSASDGTFSLRLARGTSVDLRVAADGFGTILREKCLAGERVEVRLPRGSTLVVTAVDEQDRPVAGAVVRVWRNTGGIQQLVPIGQRFEATTSSDGVARVGGLLAGQIGGQVRHATLGAPKWSWLSVPASGEVPLRVVLPVGRAVRGRVTESGTGRAILGARVTAGSPLERAATTDAEGRYELGGWTDAGMGALTAEAPGRLSRWLPVGDAEVLDFVLEPAGTATGRIVGPYGAPAPGAYVVLRSQWTEKRPAVRAKCRAGADGRFTIDGVDPGFPHTLVAAADGVGRGTLTFDAPAAGTPIDLGDVRLGATRSIEGVATDGDGVPLPEVTVSLSGPLDESSPSRGAPPKALPLFEERRTDDLGRFRFPDVRPGAYDVFLSVLDAPRVEPVRVVLPAESDVRDVAIRLAGARVLPILVTEESGAPIANAYVQLNGQFGYRGSSMQPVTLYTDARGRTRARGLPAAETMVYVHAPSERRDLIRPVPSPVVPDGTEYRVVLRRVQEVCGVVVDADGRPVPRIRVEAVPLKAGGTAQDGLSGEDGRFACRVPPGETVNLVVSGMQTFHTKRVSRSISTPWRGRLDGVTSPASDLVLRLTREGGSGDRTLTVIVLDSAGQPVPEIDVTVSPVERGAGVLGITGKDGTARVEYLTGDEAFVHVGTPLPPDWEPARLEFRPAPVQVTPAGQTLTMRFRPAVPIRGRILDADGKAVRETFVQVSAPDGTTAHARTDADGRFVAPGLPGVTHWLSCHIRDANGEERSGQVSGVVPGESGTEDEVVLTIAPPAKSPR